MSQPKRSNSKVTVQFTDRALLELHGVESYSIAQWGQRTAAAYLDAITESLVRLREHPELLRIERNLSTVFYIYRVRKHCLICLRFDDLIVVVAVIHTAMDLPNRLNELQPTLSDEGRILAKAIRRTIE